MKKRLFCIFVCSFLLLATCLGVAAAPSAGADFLGEQDYIEWTLSEDRKTISGNGRTYTYYTHRQLGSAVLFPESYYYYKNKLDFLPPGVKGEYALAQIKSARRDTDIIWLSREEKVYVYATAQGKQHLDGFLGGGSASAYRLIDGNYNQTRVDRSMMETLNALRYQSRVTSKSYRSSSLEGKPQYRVGGMDEKDELMLTYGMLFTLSDGYYYLDFSEKDLVYNDVFEKDTVYTLYKLNEDSAQKVTAMLERLENLKASVIYEDDRAGADVPIGDYANTVDVEGATTLFLVLLVLFGLVLPLAPIVLGLLLPLSKRLKHPKHWYAFAVAGALWLIAAAALLILFVTV